MDVKGRGEVRKITGKLWCHSGVDFMEAVWPNMWLIIAEYFVETLPGE